jgi:hypothetical protein
MPGDRLWAPGLNRGLKRCCIKEGRSHSKLAKIQNERTARKRRKKTPHISIQVGKHLTFTVEETEATI